MFTGKAQVLWVLPLIGVAARACMSGSPSEPEHMLPPPDELAPQELAYPHLEPVPGSEVHRTKTGRPQLRQHHDRQQDLPVEWPWTFRDGPDFYTWTWDQEAGGRRHRLRHLFRL